MRDLHPKDKFDRPSADFGSPPRREYQWRGLHIGGTIVRTDRLGLIPKTEEGR